MTIITFKELERPFFWCNFFMQQQKKKTHSSALINNVSTFDVCCCRCSVEPAGGAAE